jgi:23S rRNA pseudouridine2605 synthase
MRINQFIAKSTGISRRKADEEIKSKRVKVNGTLAELSHSVTEEDTIEYFNGKVWSTLSADNDDNTVVLMYKPVQVMSTRSDPEGRKTIYNVLPSKYRDFKSAGRLDYMSEGLLILSRNGKLILSLTHPKFKTKKRYLLGLKNVLSQKHIDLAQSGDLVIDNYKLNPVNIEEANTAHYQYLRLDPKSHWYMVTLSEGRNRQIRKMIQKFGNQITKLIRVSHGTFELDEEVYRKRYRETTLASYH